MLKSASTFLYQLTDRVFELAGLEPVLLKPPLGRPGALENPFDYIDEDVLARISAEIGDRNIVLKTHGHLSPVVAERISRGEILASVALRDPREIALAMVDHGDRARRWRQAAFLGMDAVTDTLDAIEVQIAVARAWAATPRAEVFRYNDIGFDTAAVIDRIGRQVGVQVSPQDAIAPFRDKSAIGQFSKGVPLRYRELPAEQQQLFLDRFAAFYADFTFDTPAATALADRLGDPRAKRPRGGLAQEFTYWRRRLRSETKGRL